MTTYSFSPSMRCFLLNDNRQNYQLHENWPSDAIQIEDKIADEFVTTPPEGKRLGVAGNMPVWVDSLS